jgi:hypothetical protein
MAGLGRRTFAPGEVLTASNVMNYLQDQVVQNYAGTAARGSAIGSAVSQGMVSYLDDSNSLEVYKTTGTAVAGWEPVNMAQSPNVVINGGFDIWQRGTATVSGIANAAFHPDRWFAITDGVGTVNSSRIDIASQGIGSQYAWRLERTSGTNRWVAIQMAEGALSLVGKTVTLSFYLRKGSALTAGITYDLSTRNVKFGTTYNRVAATIPNANINTSTFTRFSVTMPITTLTSTNNADLFEIEFTAEQAGASNAFFELAGVQLEAGQTATTFRRNANSLQGELAACQRYYFRVTSRSGNIAAFLSNYQPVQSTTSANALIQPPVTMRSLPTAVDFANIRLDDTVSNPAISALALRSSWSSDNLVTLTATSSGLTALRSYAIIDGGTGTGFIGLSAEL